MSSPIAQVHEEATQTPAPRRLAEVRYRANLLALKATQPLVAASIGGPTEEPADLTWVYGRDGSLTARDAEGRWVGGSSLPLRVGRSLFDKLELKGAVGCLLAPATAGQIRAVLDKTAAEQGIIVVMPETNAARAALHCEDFSDDIHARRLWLTMGPQWPAQLSALLQEQPGLCVPQQFVRSGVLDEALTAELIAAATPLLSDETARRAAAIGELLHRTTKSKAADGICVVAGSKFSLDDLAGPAMAVALSAGGEPWPRVDISLPTSASPLMLAQTAAKCAAVVAADLYRADFPGVVPDDVAWVTWATRPRITPPAAGADRDAILLADDAWRKTAAEAGWHKDRVKTAGWPSLADPKSTDAPADGPLALIADAPMIDMPAQLKDFSSHGVLWKQIAAELAEDPFAAGEHVEAYLSSRIRRVDIDAEALNRELFRTRLILPAWRRGVARRMIKAGLPLALFGAGWDGEFASHWGGPITDMESLRRAARLARAIVHPSPGAPSHYVHTLGRPVALAQRVLAGQSAIPAKNPAPPLSPQFVLSVL